MPDLTATSLSADESALLERFATVLGQQLADRLHGVWLFGSRARGEPPEHEDSDVDLLVLVDDSSWEGKQRVYKALDEASRQLGLERLRFTFAVHIHTPDWLAGRRAIRSFFIAEVDRDKVVITGTS